MQVACSTILSSAAPGSSSSSSRGDYGDGRRSRPCGRKRVGSAVCGYCCTTIGQWAPPPMPTVSLPPPHCAPAPVVCEVCEQMYCCNACKEADAGTTTSTASTSDTGLTHNRLGGHWLQCGSVLMKECVSYAVRMSVSLCVFPCLPSSAFKYSILTPLSQTLITLYPPLLPPPLQVLSPVPGTAATRRGCVDAAASGAVKRCACRIWAVHH